MITRDHFPRKKYTPEGLQSRRPIIDIAHANTDLSPYNKIHVFPMDRNKADIRDGGSISMKFPATAIQEAKCTIHGCGDNVEAPYLDVDERTKYYSERHKQ